MPDMETRTQASMGRGRKKGIRPVVEVVADSLRMSISLGDFPPGTMLPPERELSGRLKVSRMSLSRALSRLAAEGIIDQRVGVGTRVTDDADKRLPTNRVCVVCIDRLTASSMSEPVAILRGITESLDSRRLAYDVIYRDDKKEIDKLTRQHAARRYGGLIFLESELSNIIVKLHEADIPVVVANLESELDVDATLIDHRRVTMAAVGTLVAFGHRRIGLISTRPSMAFYRKTLEGFLAAQTEFQLSADENLIGICPVTSPLDAYFAARQMLETALRPTAIVAGRDLHAEGVCRAAEELGLVIGRDLSVIGYDNVSWLHGADFLTTFREPCFELGAEAVDMLVKNMRARRNGKEKRVIPAPLVLRRSAAPLLAPPDKDFPDPPDFELYFDRQ